MRKTFQTLVAEAKAQITEISADSLRQLKAEQKPFTLIDVREADDFANGHIDGAIHLSRGMLELDIEETVPNLDQPLVLYCGGGSRSALAAKTLQEMGYTQVSSLMGGYRNWSDQ